MFEGLTNGSQGKGFEGLRLGAIGDENWINMAFSMSSHRCCSVPEWLVSISFTRRPS